tara:strand:- start:531 stop:1865 length:1335 start_codon:yes stop_codon:yes gene_type:complete
MAAYQITGTVQDPSGNGVPDVVLELSPAPSAIGAAQAVGGIGIVQTPKQYKTAADGTFAIDAIEGFRYRLEICAVGFDRTFVMPGAAVRFDLLGLVPEMQQVAAGEDADGDPTIFVVVKVADEGVVRERYDDLLIQRATALGGPFVLVDTQELIPGKTFYEFHDDTVGDLYYRARYGRGGDYSQYSDVVTTVDSEEEALLINPDELVELYLFGADLTDDDGNPFPRRMFEHYIEAGVDWLSKELDIPLVAQDIEEVHDHYRQDYGSWGYFQLDKYPVVQVNSVHFQYPSMTTAVLISDEWIVLSDEGKSGVIQIVPGQGNIADVLMIPGALMPLWSGATGRVPGIWHFNYRAGFEPGELPPDLKHAIGMWASIGVLNIAGDLIAGAGIATKSVSVPGLNQNIGTTSSATNSGYGARIIEYQKELKEMLPNLRRFYGKNTRMVVA